MDRAADADAAAAAARSGASLVDGGELASTDGVDELLLERRRRARGELLPFLVDGSERVRARLPRRRREVRGDPRIGQRQEALRRRPPLCGAGGCWLRGLRALARVLELLGVAERGHRRAPHAERRRAAHATHAERCLPARRRASDRRNRPGKAAGIRLHRRRAARGRGFSAEDLLSERDRVERRSHRGTVLLPVLHGLVVVVLPPGRFVLGFVHFSFVAFSVVTSSQRPP